MAMAWSFRWGNGWAPGRLKCPILHGMWHVAGVEAGGRWSGCPGAAAQPSRTQRDRQGSVHSGQSAPHASTQHTASRAVQLSLSQIAGHLQGQEEAGETASASLCVAA